MGIKLVTFAAQTVTPQDDALIYETALQESGMIYGGSVSIKNANVLHVEAGHGALCGRKFTIEATDVPVPLTASGSLQGRIYIHMDLSDTGEPISFQVETASTLTPVVQQSDVNINSGIYEINLATFIVDTSTISNLVNVAPFIDIEPDSELSAQSNNPVQNKIITKAVGDPETIGGLASKPYSIGELILASDGQLYKATANIAQNATIVSGGNADPTGNIVSQISNFANMITTRSFNSGIYALAINGSIRHQLGIALPGYTPLGIIQVGVTYYSLCSIGEMQISNNTAYISVRNESQSDIYNQSTSFVVLYKKNNE
ncbi:MAG: hypothetical protein IKQ00_00030 [Butyrivibrio sp.]|nr:hypothetical protein [Butyrivibrio sp.]